MRLPCWNMVLNETCKSWWDWAQNTLIIVDRKTGQVRYTDEYYLMKHLSHFVQPGSRLLKVSDGKNTLAFRSHDGKVVVVAYNPEEQERPCSFKVGSKYIRVILKGKSINTIVI
jgi:glucosylceramidase